MEGTDPGVWVAVIAFAGITFSAVVAFAGRAWKNGPVKANGMIKDIVSSHERTAELQSQVAGRLADVERTLRVDHAVFGEKLTAIAASSKETADAVRISATILEERLPRRG